MLSEEDKNQLRSSLLDALVPFKENYSLSEGSYFKTGGPAAFFVLPTTSAELALAVGILNEKKVRFKVIGATSNLLFRDEANYSCLLSTIHLDKIVLDLAKKTITAGAGAMLPDLSRVAVQASIGGFAGMEGIPGSVGGAVFMNAGAYGDSIGKVLEKVTVLSEEGNLTDIGVDELKFSYRDSVFKSGENKGIVVEAQFKAEPGDQRALVQKMELVHAKRHRYNEYVFPNLGSAFSGSIYRALAKKDRVYWLVSTMFYLLNYRFKIFRRESPINRKWINDYTAKRFGFDASAQQYSDKTINTVVNKGQGSAAVISYIEMMEKLTDSSVPVENEVVDEF